MDTYVILSEQMTSSCLPTIWTASCMLTSQWPARWCNAFLVIVFTPVMSSSCVLFKLESCLNWNHEQYIHNMNILFVDVLESWTQNLECEYFVNVFGTVLTLIWFFVWHLFQTVLCCVAFLCRPQHIDTRPLSHLYLDNWDQSNTAIAWCHCWLSNSSVKFCCVELLWPIQFESFENGKFVFVGDYSWLWHVWKSLYVHFIKYWLCSKMYSTCSQSICLVWL